MDSKISLIVMTTGASVGKEISNLCETIEWSGRRGSPTRTLKITLLDDDGYDHERSGINIEEGWHCLFSYDGVELFRGIFLKQSTSYTKQATYTAYDLGIYLSNNRDTFVYENKTATDVFNDVCTRFGIPVGGAAQTTYIIPDLVKKKSTAWDAIEDALSLDFDNTGIKHYVFAEKGQLFLRKRTENILQWVLETGANITKYKYDIDMSSIKTRIKLLSDEGTVIAEGADASLEAKIGTFQEVDTPDETLTTAQINSLVKAVVEENATPVRSLSLTDVLGLTDVISGVGVFVIIEHLGLNKTFYVDEDTHVFQDQLHTMSLTLNLVSDIGKGEEPAEETEQKSYQVGDIVQFNGGKHYVSSTASTAASSNLKPGPAKITLTNPGSLHPWHLIHTDSQTTVYGWVDDGSFS